MDIIDKTTQEFEDMIPSENGKMIKELIDKINEIVEWINNQ